MGKSFLFAAATSLLILTCSLAVGADPPRANGLVTTTGTHDLHGGKLVVRVTEQGNKLFWSVQRVADPAAEVAGKTVSREDPPIAKGSAWFVFAPSAEVAWVYDGAKGLTVLDFRKGAASGLTNAELPGGWADLPKNPPKEVVDRLPAALRPKEKVQK